MARHNSASNFRAGFGGGLVAGFRCPGGDKNLVDPLAVHVDNLELKAVPEELFALARDVAEPVEDEPPESGKAVFVLSGQVVLDAEAGLRLIDVEHGVDDPGAVLAEHRLRVVALLALGEVADDRHHHIVERDEPLEAAEFVDDERDVLPGFFERLDEPAGGHGGRDVERGGDEGAELDAAGQGEVRPERLHRDHADHVVPGLLVNRKVRVPAAGDLPPVFVVRIVEGEPDDPGARGHEVAGHLLVELEDAFDHVFLSLFKDPGAEPLIDEDADLLLRDGGLLGLPDPEEGHEEIA